jgi:hypothetical protein
VEIAEFYLDVDGVMKRRSRSAGITLNLEEWNKFSKSKFINNKVEKLENEKGN